MKAYIGWDSNEVPAYQVALASLKAKSGILAEPLKASKLASRGLLHRAVDLRGQPYDLPSNAPCSTEFAASRFLVPILCQKGWALFTDCDVLFLDDVHKMLSECVLADPGKAVYVVQHNHQAKGEKMAGLAQVPYYRKNWSSVMLFNCDHPAHDRLTLNDINTRPGRHLHRFYWLHDSEIGALDPRWNWLVNEQPRPEKVGIAHFTNGGPWLKGWKPQKYDNLWAIAHQRYARHGKSTL